MSFWEIFMARLSVEKVPPFFQKIRFWLILTGLLGVALVFLVVGNVEGKAQEVIRIIGWCMIAVGAVGALNNSLPSVDKEIQSLGPKKEPEKEFEEL